MNKLLIALILVATCSCGLKGGMQRGYIISHSQLEEVEVEVEELD